MDPDVTLAKIRDLVAEIKRDEFAAPESAAEAGEELAQAVDDLDKWLSRRGFLPAPWRAAQ